MSGRLSRRGRNISRGLKKSNLSRLIEQHARDIDATVDEVERLLRKHGPSSKLGRRLKLVWTRLDTSAADAHYAASLLASLSKESPNL